LVKHRIYSKRLTDTVRKAIFSVFKEDRRINGLVTVHPEMFLE